MNIIIMHVKTCLTIKIRRCHQLPNSCYAAFRRVILMPERLGDNGLDSLVCVGLREWGVENQLSFCHRCDKFIAISAPARSLERSLPFRPNIFNRQSLEVQLECYTTSRSFASSACTCSRSLNISGETRKQKRKY